MKLKYITLVLALVLAGSGVFAWSKLTSTEKTASKKAQHKELDEPAPLDIALLAKFANISEQFDLSKKDLLLVGKLSVADGADSTGKIIDAPYVFSKRGNDFYFKLGRTETINANGLYVFIDHDVKKVMVSAQKDIAPSLPIPSGKQLFESLKGEGYELYSKIEGNTEKLAFVNNLHLSCKEYALYMGRQSNQLQRVLIRLTNIQNIESQKLDKIIELKLSKVSNDPAIDSYISQHFIKEDGKDYRLVDAYHDYELIKN